MYVDVLGKESILSSLKKLGNSSNSIGKVSAMDFGGSPIITDRKDHSLLGIKSKLSGIDDVLLGIILESMYKSESSGPGSHIIIQDFIERNLLNLCRQSEIGNSKLISFNPKNISKSIKEAIESSSQQDVEYIINGLIQDDSISSLVLDACKMSGPQVKIFVNNENGFSNSISYRSGYTFDVTLPIGPFHNEQKWEREWSKVVIIDGIIQ
jgi:hypothetical protein